MALAATALAKKALATIALATIALLAITRSPGHWRLCWQRQSAWRWRLPEPPTAKSKNSSVPSSCLQSLESGQAARVPPALASDQNNEQLLQRVRELEIAKAANEQATRLIIQDSLAKTGSKINDAVSLGGAIEMLVGKSTDFSNTSTDSLKLNAAELDLEIQVNPWTLGSFALQYVDGTGLRPGSGAPSAAALSGSVDRINLDRAYFTLGDTQRFPLYLRLGRQPLPFGTSSGVHRADVLSIDSPLTVEAFEIKKNAVGLGFGLPTPVPTRAPPPVFAPPVQPLLFSPLVGRFAQGLGYKPPVTRPKPPNPTSVTPDMPPFYGSLYVYDSSDSGAAPRAFTENISARLGYRASGHCGKPYSELSNTGVCPWTLDVNLDYNSSVFDSKFLVSEYSAFANQFGAVKGLAANAKLTLGRVSLVGEWNGATQPAQFLDGLGNGVSIQPSAWAVSMGYQFGWNPWVASIGGQGTFAAVSYSETRDLAGVTLVSGGVNSRVGFLPKQRLTMTLGEWLTDGVKVVFEYSLTRDYSPTEGGTGATGRSLSAVLNYSW
jgi:hypothetical protein